MVSQHVKIFKSSERLGVSASNWEFELVRRDVYRFNPGQILYFYILY